MILRFVLNSEKCRKYTFLGGTVQIITILHRFFFRNFLQYYMGGVSRDPKFVLRNIRTAPYVGSKWDHLGLAWIDRDQIGFTKILTGII